MNLWIVNHRKPSIFICLVTKWVIRTFVLLLVLNIGSCNYPNDDGNENYFTTPYEFHFPEGSVGGIIDVNLNEMGNVPFRVVLFPKWMDIKLMEGRLANGLAQLPFEFKNVQEYTTEGKISGNLVLRIGDVGLFDFIVTYGLDFNTDPVDNEDIILSCSVAELNFDVGDNLTFTLENQGKQGKSWYVTDLPSWLQLSENSGYIEAGNQLTIQCMVNRTDLSPGDYSQHINIESANPRASHGIIVSMKVENQGNPVNLDNIKWIEGKLIDAYYSKTTDYLYLLTQKPNALLVKKPESDSLHSISLSKMPNCIDVSKDGKTLAIGYNQAVVDIFDAQNFGLKRSYETDCIPFDLVYDEKGWCYLTPILDQWVSLYSLNLNTGVSYRQNAKYPFYEKAIIKKAPDKPLLYATNPQLSPQGFMIVNIANGVANDTIPNWHVETGGAFWISKDGKKLLTGFKKVFKTPEYTRETYNMDLSLIGLLDVPGGNVSSLDFCEILNCYFAVGSDYWWSPYNSETIYRLDAENYMANYSVKVQPYPGYLANQNNPQMDIKSVFSNSKGTKLFALKNVPYDFQMEKWALEIIDLL